MVSPEDVRKVAQASKLLLTPEEEQRFARELSAILQAFSALDTTKTRSVEPAYQPVPLQPQLREDRIEASLPQEEALANTKNTEKGSFKGPKVV